VIPSPNAQSYVYGALPPDAAPEKLMVSGACPAVGVPTALAARPVTIPIEVVLADAVSPSASVTVTVAV
jgi:hypothetical protein